MGIANHVIRRGKYYAWRRLYCGRYLQIPLSTADPFEAKRLASVATNASNFGWNLLDQGKAGLSTVRDGIATAIKRERLAIDIEAAGGDPATIPGGSAFFFFFATDETPDEEPEKPKGRQEPSGQANSIHQQRQMKRASSKQTVKRPAHAEPSKGGFSTRIIDVVSRLSATHAHTGRANAKTLTQLRVISELFCEVTGVDDVRTSGKPTLQSSSPPLISCHRLIAEASQSVISPYPRLWRKLQKRAFPSVSPSRLSSVTSSISARC